MPQAVFLGLQSTGRCKTGCTGRVVQRRIAGKQPRQWSLLIFEGDLYQLPAIR